MIELYTWPTPNGHKVHIALEELGLPYTVHAVDIGAGDQFKPDFLKISPNNRIPAIVDRDGPGGRQMALFESGAILIYLAEKTGRLLAPKGSAARYAAIQWLMFQMGGIGPMLGQSHHFRVFAPEKYQYAIDRYTNEAKRLYGVLDRRLGEAPYLAGAEYGIADIATFPWLRYSEHQGVVLAEYPNVQRWFDVVASRPAVERGLQVLIEHSYKTPITEAQREILFGSKQYERR
ncbi:MAG: glutathione S-transferase N-terminal domain-containing protein [Rhodospirillaceae bacterium]|nr:glutathione S-transferase N-terminal domain-containing protein [Rhodospirillaceae bacterium]